MAEELETVLAPHTPAVRGLAEQARALVLAVFPAAIEQPDLPAKLIGYGFDRTYKGMVCGIALHKQHINLMFARGVELPDPDGLLTGTGVRARHVKITAAADLDRPGVRALLEAAVATTRRLLGLAATES